MSCEIFTGRIWLAISKRQSFTAAQISEQTGISPKQVREALARWRKQGLIEQLGDQRSNKVFAFVSDIPQHEVKPYKRNTRQQIWNSLKLLKKVDLKVLCMVTDSSPTNSRDYLNALERCGYVQGQRKHNNRSKHWVFLKDTGRSAPSHIKGKGVYDKNLDSLVLYKSA